jgi:hypothetical protein
VYKELWTAEAASKAARFVFVDPRDGEGLGDLQENAACALAVADWLDLPRDRAAKAIRAYKPDPGVFSVLRWTRPGSHRVWFADALAANDPESSDRLAQRALAFAECDGMDRVTGHTERILLVVLRRDRPERTKLFVDYALARCRRTSDGSPSCPGTAGTDDAGTSITVPDEAGFLFDRVAFIGSLPPSGRARLVRAGIQYGVTGLRKRKILTTLEDLVGNPGRDVFVFAAGNRVGFGKAIHDWAVSKAQEQGSGKIDGAAKEARP